MAAHFADHLCPWLSKPHARYALHKTAYKHRPQVRKRTITRKSELLAPWQGLQSTCMHADKTGNKTGTKRYVKQLTEHVIPNANATNLCQSTARGFKYKNELRSEVQARCHAGVSA